MHLFGWLSSRTKKIGISFLVAPMLAAIMAPVYLTKQVRGDRYEVHVVIDDVDFGRFDELILEGHDLLAHLPHSFNPVPHHASSIAPPFDEIFRLSPKPSHSDDDPRGGLFLKRKSVNRHSLYSWLKNKAQVHQNPQNVELVLVKVTSLHKAHNDPSLSVEDKISLQSSTPLIWSLESQKTSALGHYHEYAYISFRTLSRSIADQIKP